MIAGTFLAITRQLRELFKPSSDSGSLVSIKKVFTFGFSFSVGDVTSGGVFEFLANFIWPWAPTQRAVFDSCFFGNYEARIRL